MARSSAGSWYGERSWIIVLAAALGAGIPVALASSSSTTRTMVSSSPWSAIHAGVARCHTLAEK